MDISTHLDEKLKKKVNSIVNNTFTYENKINSQINNDHMFRPITDTVAKIRPESRPNFDDEIIPEIESVIESHTEPERAADPEPVVEPVVESEPVVDPEPVVEPVTAAHPEPVSKPRGMLDYLANVARGQFWRRVWNYHNSNSK